MRVLLSLTIVVWVVLFIRGYTLRRHTKGGAGAPEDRGAPAAADATVDAVPAPVADMEKAMPPTRDDASTDLTAAEEKQIEEEERKKTDHAAGGA